MYRSLAKKKEKWATTDHGKQKKRTLFGYLTQGEKIEKPGRKREKNL